MKQSTLPILVGAALLLALLAAAVLLRRAPTEEPGTAKAAIAPPRIPPSSSDPQELGRARERIAALEAELERVRAVQARSEKLLADLKPVAEMVEKARTNGASSEAKSDSDEKAFSTAMMGPRAAAGLLGLSGARRDDFKRAFDDAVEKIRALESTRAKVTVDGNRTRIEIPAFPQEAEAVYSAWLDWARGFFTPAEKENFNSQRMFDNLFGFKRGAHNRVILLERSGDGNLSVHETDAGGSSGSFNGPEDAQMLAAYAHLLKK